jgi:hypothetical protein
VLLAPGDSHGGCSAGLAPGRTEAAGTARIKLHSQEPQIIADRLRIISSGLWQGCTGRDVGPCDGHEVGWTGWACDGMSGRRCWRRMRRRRRWRDAGRGRRRGHPDDVAFGCDHANQPAVNAERRHSALYGRLISGARRGAWPVLIPLCVSAGAGDDTVGEHDRSVTECVVRFSWRRLCDAGAEPEDFGIYCARQAGASASRWPRR